MDSELVRSCLEEEPLSGKRVIDFCCGGGETGTWMAGHGAEVYLVDFSRATVDAALACAQLAGLERRVRGILIRDSRLDMFADKGFDLVLTRGVPESALLSELARVMKPDARLVVAASEGGEDRLTSAGFGEVRVRGMAKAKGLVGKLIRKKKRGETVITARRA